MSKIVNNAFVWLSIQRALLGSISKQMLGVCVDVKENIVSITLYAENELTEKEREEIENVALLVNADIYPEIPHVEINMIENSGVVLISRGHWVFLRMGCQVKDG